MGRNGSMGNPGIGRRPGRPPKKPRIQGSVAIPRSKRYQELIDGTIKVEDLSDEEIRRGQLMDSSGGFSGRPPELIPRDMYMALTKELRARMNKKFEEHAIEAVETIVEIMREGEGAEETEFDEYSGKPVGKTKAGVKRLEASKYIVERVLGQLGKNDGKAEEELTPWQRAQSNGALIVDIEPDEEDAHLITEMQLPRKPIRRRMIRGEVVDE